jgi:type II secretory pathway pseudopilin PulG
VIRSAGSHELPTFDTTPQITSTDGMDRALHCKRAMTPVVLPPWRLLQGGQMTRQPEPDWGFALAELLVAMALIAVAVAGLAALIVLAVRVAAGAHEQTRATILAAQKLEQLRVETAGTVPGAAGSLATSVPGYVDWLDRDGQPAAGPSAVYVRRWAVGPVSGVPDVGLLQVLVSSVIRDRSAASPRVRQANEALLVTFNGRR